MRNRNKRIISTIILVGIIVVLIGAIAAVGYKILQLRAGDSPAGDNPPVTGEGFIKAEDEIVRALEDSMNINQPYSELTTSEKISYQLVKQVSVETIDETDEYATVEITYPDVADAFEELYDGANDAEKIEQLYSSVLERLEKEEVDIIQKEIDVEYNDEHTGILWTDTLVDAMSGGLYSLSSIGK